MWPCPSMLDQSPINYATLTTLFAKFLWMRVTKLETQNSLVLSNLCLTWKRKKTLNWIHNNSINASHRAYYGGCVQYKQLCSWQLERHTPEQLFVLMDQISVLICQLRNDAVRPDYSTHFEQLVFCCCWRLCYAVCKCADSAWSYVTQ